MAFCATRRRMLCLLTALLFGISAVAHAHAIINMTAKMAHPVMAMSTPDDGMDCGGDDKAAHAACVAMCATAMAILCDPVSMPLVMALQELHSNPELPIPGRGPAPEPHPPKPLA